MVDWGFESVYQHSFVFRKELEDVDWSGAKLYRGDPEGLHTLSDEEFKKTLQEVRGK
ncbi:MAG TPA: hypothetical protein VF593_07055 [Chthoniobacteraceae bacterium]